MANACIGVRHYGEAADYWIKVLDIRTAALGDAHERTSSAARRLGDTQFTMKAYDAALASYSKVRATGNRDDCMAADRFMGRIYHMRSQPDRARLHFMTSFVMRITSNGWTVDAAVEMTNIAHCLNQLGLHDEALLQLAVATVILDHNRLVPDEDVRFCVYNNFGDAYAKKGLSVAAADYYKKAVGTGVSAYGAAHARTVAAQANLDAQLALLGPDDGPSDDDDDAEEFYEEPLPKRARTA